MLEQCDRMRLAIAKQISQQRKSEFGQFMTPLSTASFMASLFSSSTQQTCSLLDAGAGIGSLSAAFFERCISDNLTNIEATLYEIDDTLRIYLNDNLATYRTQLNLSSKIISRDFIDDAVDQIQKEIPPQFTHAILNPPYKKIRSNSVHRLLLRKVGIETVNLYSAFVSLALTMMKPGGQIVAIIPRSFCNGPYYRAFREFIFTHAAIQHMHLFTSRSQAFKDDDVLQENIIILLERDAQQGNVTVSTSTDDRFNDYKAYIHSFEKIVFENDPERFIHVPTSLKLNSLELSPAIRYTLDDLGIKVSTGPVVDFRMREHIRHMPEPGCVPLLYPGHFSDQNTEWPKENIKKPNAIHRNAETEKWLYPIGFYAVVRRFSSKEEKRRINASIVDPKAFSGSDALGFENYLNVFHNHKHGLPEPLARGLSLYLNTKAVDEQFRRFNGHTQVNATDLKLIKYPSRDALIALGEWAVKQSKITATMIDEQLELISA